MYQVFTGGPIGDFLMNFVGGEPKPWEFRHGETQNTADLAYRKSQREYERSQRAKGGVNVSAGQNTQAALRNRQRPQFGRQGGSGWSPTTTTSGGGQGYIPGAPTPVYVPLGTPSKAFMDKYKRWGALGRIMGNQGWRDTLTAAPSSQSNAQSQRLHKTEGIQTRETRRQSDLRPFVKLQGHYNTPQLNPGLSYMFKRKNLQLGPVRRAVSRLI
jgi:hypothetical protein